MKYKIEINNPCSEAWEKMTLTEQGRFCQSCNKEVTDFTNLTHGQIIAELEKSSNTCGRFKKRHIDQPIVVPTNKSSYIGSVLISTFIGSITPLFGQKVKEPIVNVQESSSVVMDSSASKYIISGIITDSYGYPLPGANLTVLGTENGDATDFDGLFTIEFDKEFKGTVSVHYMGFKSYDFEVNQNTKYVTIAMEEDPEVVSEIIVLGGYNYCPERQTLFTAIRRLYFRIFH